MARRHQTLPAPGPEVRDALTVLRRCRALEAENADLRAINAKQLARLLAAEQRRDHLEAENARLRAARGEGADAA